ncbi:exocyst complex component exo84 [Marasmius crinis-equi]|uniref:Exocyst complex component EXO84 n=1 Tax=Marasmius crinis-equi TaxID=585013 RepID=A0ABR3EYB5_9AGAR
MQRMQSLRSRRSQRAQAPRKPSQGGATKLAKPGAGPTPRPKPDSRKSRVDDKIKKRMSMRYADISGPTDLNVPPMPTIGTGIGAIRVAPRGRERDEELVGKEDLGREQVRDKFSVDDDMKLLDNKDFDPDACELSVRQLLVWWSELRDISDLKSKLANSTEAEIKSLQSSLRGAKDGTASELQRNVFKNYAEFVNISKEISTLENEMLELKESLSEYKSMPSMLHIPDPTSSSSSLSTYRRSSVADLRIMYFNQMQTLHTQVEGSSKLAPTTPGRHVVSEADGIIALNSATYKVTGKVKFIVLDDMLLVAKRRKKAGESSSSGKSEGKLVADKAWTIGDTLVLDTKDSPSMTNVFKIRYGKETHVYRTETPNEKKTLLAQLRQVGDELIAKKRKEREGEHERRKTLWNGNERGGSAQDWMADLAARAGESSSPASDAKQKAERDARWTSEWADDLNVAIALKEWDKAVKLVEEGKARLAMTPPLAPKLPLLTTQLTNALLDTLSQASNRKTVVVHLISLLLRLGAGAAARSTFLKMRSQVVRDLVRKIKFEGHIGAYVGDLAMVYFTAIKHTADWFLASFKENEVASAFIDWARGQVENYAEIFRSQVYTGDVVEPKVVEEAMKITYSLSRKLLEEYGLDFRFLLDEQLIEKPKDGPKPTITAYSTEGHQMLQRYSLQKSILRKTPTPASGSIALSASTSSLASIDLGSADTAGTSRGIPSTASVAASSATSLETPITPSSSRPQLQPPSVAGPRPRTPTTPSGGGAPMPSSPLPRRTRTPPPHNPGQREPFDTPSKDRERERPPRSVRSSPAPPPPRSQNRPSSIRPVPVAVPQRDGMI